MADDFRELFFWLYQVLCLWARARRDSDEEDVAALSRQGCPSQTSRVTIYEIDSEVDASIYIYISIYTCVYVYISIVKKI